MLVKYEIFVVLQNYRSNSNKKYDVFYANTYTDSLQRFVTNEYSTQIKNTSDIQNNGKLENRDFFTNFKNPFIKFAKDS